VHARRLLAGVDAATDAVRRVGQGRTGRLGLAFVAASAWSVLPPLLAQLRTDLPDVTVDLLEAGPDDVVEQVRAGRSDLGLVLVPPQPVVERDLDVAVVHREPLVAVLPRRHPLAAGERVDLAALAGEPFLAPARTLRGALHPHLVAACRLAGFEPEVREVGLAQTVVAFVGAGLGVSVLPAGAGSVCGDDAVAVPLRLNAPVVETALVRRRASTPSPVTRRFLRLAMATPEPDVLGPDLARKRR
jgi:DNA-binding transcriptional LysR family regulator